MNREIQAVGLDIGTSKVRCVIGEPSENGLMNIVGIGQADSRGLRRGIVTTTEAVAESIKRAVEEAERVSGWKVQMATINLSGEHLRGENKSGVVAVAGAGREITIEDVERAIESASAMQLPAGWEIIDRLPQEFIIDGQDGIVEPIGMTRRAARMPRAYYQQPERRAGKMSSKRSIDAGLEIERMMLEPLAAAESTLTDDDKEYGCGARQYRRGSDEPDDFRARRGAAHSRFSVRRNAFYQRHRARVARFDSRSRTRLNSDYGCVAGFLMDDEERQEIIEITPVGRNETRGLSKEILCDIMQPRAIELLQHVAHEVINASGQISSGVILTGGSAMIRGTVEIAEQVFDAPTRLGFLE